MNHTTETFKSIHEFVEALNSYTGENIWQDLIYGSNINGDEIDEDRSADGVGQVIYLKDDRTIRYGGVCQIWRYCL